MTRMIGFEINIRMVRDTYLSSLLIPRPNKGRSRAPTPLSGLSNLLIPYPNKGQSRAPTPSPVSCSAAPNKGWSVAPISPVSRSPTSQRMVRGPYLSTSCSPTSQRTVQGPYLSHLLLFHLFKGCSGAPTSLVPAHPPQQRTFRSPYLS
jgi:hypothetical protein